MKKTLQQFKKEMQEINPNLEILGPYLGATKKIKYKCKLCGSIGESTPDSLLHGTKCKCQRKRNTKKRTHEEFIQLLNEINPNITILGKYINNSTKILCQCDKCKYKWEATPAHLLNKHGCPSCAHRVPYNKETYNQKLKELNKNIECISEYGSKVTLVCQICGYKWETKPTHVIYENGCPRCHKREKYTPERFKELIESNNPYIEVLSDYVNYNSKIKCKCKKCGKIWYTQAGNLLCECGCPKCRLSKGEKLVAKILDKYDINYVQQSVLKHKFEGHKIIVDFILKHNSKIYIIEYNGRQHYESVDIFGGEEKFKYQTKRDSFLKNLCAIKGVTLLEIPYIWTPQQIEQYLVDNLIK